MSRIVPRLVPLAAALVAGSALAAYPPDALPPEHHDGAVAWVSGGIGQAESQAMRRAASRYPLELLFVARLHRNDDYLASMPVTIRDARGRVVFRGTSHGPYFLARVPAGRYTVTSELNGRRITHPVRVGGPHRHERLVFEWRGSAARDAG